MRAIILVTIFTLLLGVTNHAVSVGGTAHNHHGALEGCESTTCTAESMPAAPCVLFCLIAGSSTIPTAPAAPLLLFVLLGALFLAASSVLQRHVTPLRSDRLTEPIRLLLLRTSLRTVIIRD